MLQSCNIYHRSRVTLDEAVARDSKALIIGNNDSRTEVKRIEKIDGTYQAIKYVKGENITVTLSESEIKYIRLLNKPGTIWHNIGLAAAALAILGLIGVAIQLGNLQ